MKAYQLRVRLDEGRHEKLLELLSIRAKNETLSDIVREAIDLYLGPQTQNAENADFAIASEVKCTVRKLAHQLDRGPGQVLEDCVDGIVSILEQKRTPLIILELELRKKYYADRISKTGLPLGG